MLNFIKIDIKRQTDNKYHNIVTTWKTNRTRINSKIAYPATLKFKVYYDEEFIKIF